MFFELSLDNCPSSLANCVPEPKPYCFVSRLSTATAGLIGLEMYSTIELTRLLSWRMTEQRNAAVSKVMNSTNWNLAFPGELLV